MAIHSHSSVAALPATQLRCDVCGARASWRQRSSGACCTYGEVLCDACERRYQQRRFEKQGSFRQDAADLWGWLRQFWLTLKSSTIGEM